MDEASVGRHVGRSRGNRHGDGVIGTRHDDSGGSGSYVCGGLYVWVFKCAVESKDDDLWCNGSKGNVKMYSGV